MNVAIKYLTVLISDEPELEFSGSRRAELERFRAELGHFNFRAETELNRIFFYSFSPEVFIIRSPVYQFYVHLSELLCF